MLCLIHNNVFFSNVSPEELFVIVEYCKYGSILSYMHRNGRTFINQLDIAKGIIDPNIDRPMDRHSAMSHAQR